jgi:hypothetical protein
MLTFMTAAVIGMHIGSVHVPASDHLQNVNPGLYVRAESGATVGFYRNSHGRHSVYAGWTFERGPFALTVGGITGYQRRDVVCTGDRLAKGFTRCWDGDSSGPIGPLVAPSVRLPEFAGLTPRLTFMPKLAAKGHAVFHLTIERPL